MEMLYSTVIHLVPPWVRRRGPRIVKVIFSRLPSRLGIHPVPVYHIWTPQGNIIEPTKRGLVSYITSPFRLSPDDHRNVQFSNIGIGRTIVTIAPLQSRPAP